jgi:hypothetical protein
VLPRCIVCNAFTRLPVQHLDRLRASSSVAVGWVGKHLRAAARIMQEHVRHAISAGVFNGAPSCMRACGG